MSILSQLGVIVLIICIVLVLIKANKNLETVSEEGEHFVDEWALRQEKKAQIRSRKYANDKMLPEDVTEEEITEAEDPEGCKEEEELQEYDHSKIIPLKKAPEQQLELLQMDDNHHVIETICVDEVPFWIGRDSRNQLVLDDLCVARKHCMITEKDGKLYLKDLGTANKIYANGGMVNEIILSDHTRFYLGNTEFQVNLKERRSNPTRLSAIKGCY